MASFYASLVRTSGARWVSGGSLQDAVEGSTAGDGAPGAPQAAEGPAPAADAGGEPSHAGLGSAAARAEQAAEERQLRYEQPAGPLQRGEQPPAPGGAQQQQQQLERRAPQEGIKYGIARSNVGYRLLKKAGWTEGAGLGAQEQGVAEPVAAWQQKGNLGLGFGPRPKQGAAAAAGGAAAGEGSGAAAASGSGKQQQQQRRQQRPLPEDPLDKEDTETKVKRVRQVGRRADGCRSGSSSAWSCCPCCLAPAGFAQNSLHASLGIPSTACCKPWHPNAHPQPPACPLTSLACPQVMQAEADEKAGKAIQRYISRAFNDATGEPTADSNPLLRRNHKLSATNPLL